MNKLIFMMALMMASFASAEEDYLKQPEKFKEYITAEQFNKDPVFTDYSIKSITDEKYALSISHRKHNEKPFLFVISISPSACVSGEGVSDSPYVIPVNGTNVYFSWVCSADRIGTNYPHTDAGYDFLLKELKKEGQINIGGVIFNTKGFNKAYEAVKAIKPL